MSIGIVPDGIGDAVRVRFFQGIGHGPGNDHKDEEDRDQNGNDGEMIPEIHFIGHDTIQKIGSGHADGNTEDQGLERIEDILQADHGPELRVCHPDRSVYGKFFAPKHHIGGYGIAIK